MILEFGDRNINVAAQETEATTSPSTGKQLNKFNIKVDVKGKEALTNFQNLIEKYKEENLNELDTSGIAIRKFLITNSQYSYKGLGSDEDTAYHFVLEISEQEALSTSVIIIAGIDCEVISYDEKIDETTKAIIINAVIKQTEDDRDKIYKNIDKDIYFDVVRKDIRDDILKMRFGKIIWSKHDGFIKRKIVLVQEQYDEAGRRSRNSILSIYEPEMHNIQKLLAKQIIYSFQLEKLLINKGVIDKTDVKKMQAVVEETYLDKYKDYFIVDDVDDCDYF